MEAEINAKSDNEIQLKRNENILRLYIKDENGKRTGEYLEFDLLNPKYLLKYQDLVEEDKKNRLWFQNQLTIIDKKQDHKGKKLYSYKEEEILKAYDEFNEKTKKIYNMFLGEKGIEKLLNGRDISLNTLNEVDRIIEECILPKIEINVDNIKKMIRNKYSNLNKEKRDDVIE